MKLKKLVTALAMAIVVVFAGCKEDTFIENTGVCPVVLSTSPVNGATGVPLEAKITVTFNEKMNPETITQAAFSLTGSNLVTGGLTYNTANNTLTFVPASPLEPNITYTGRVNTLVKDLFGNALQTDYVWSFSTGATVSPIVISTDPVNDATGVFLNKKIAATFSFPMDLLTLTPTTFSVMQGTTPVAGIITINGATATFSPTSSLLANTLYTVKIATGAKNEEGTPLQSDYVWSFTTGDHKAPTVSSTDPENEATGVVLNKVIGAVFSIAMDPATMTTTSFTVKAGTVSVPGTISYAGTTASFTPTENFIPNTTYTATITTAAKSVAGAALAGNYVWTFTTIASPTITATTPVHLATNVALNQAVNAVFSVPMDAASITAASFTLKAGAVAIPGLISYNGNTATFTPVGNLVPNTIYTATVTAAAKSAAGATLANDYVWTFTTIPYPTPTITVTDPANAATGVALNKTVTATFSVPMDPASITTTSFTLKAGTTSVAGAVSLNGNTASFNPTTNLVANTVYTATITTVATSTTGVALASNHTWTFTTAAAVVIPPTVTSTDPTNLATGVALNKTVTATFSEPMNAASITTASFTVKAGAASVAGVVSYNGNTASFNPTSDLQANTVYTGTITTAATNAAGVAMASNYNWTFTTAAAVVIPPTVTSTDPANLATGVALNKTVNAVFSVQMDATTINTTSFTLKAGTNAVTGVVSYSGNTASFNPSSDLQANTVYTGTITTAARSAAGVNMATNHNWTFTTQAAIIPPVMPVDLRTVARFGIFAATGISNNAGFSEIRNLDVGISPGVRTSVTGFPPAIVVNGAIYASDDLTPVGTSAMLLQAKADLLAAYLAAEGASTPAPASVSGDQGGKTLAPGIYKTASTLLIQNGNLTLDAQGDPNAVWIFQVASSFTTIGGAGGSVILTGGAQAKNVFWQVGSSATIGDNTQFKGNILAYTSITLNSGATVVGRMLVLNGAVVLTNTNIIEKP